jgi:hypothetical protein
MVVDGIPPFKKRTQMTEQEIFIYIASQHPAPELADIMAKMDFDNETYPNLEDHLAKLSIATRSEYQRALKAALRAHRIRATLGTVPATPRQLIDAILDTTGFQIDANALSPLSWVSPVKRTRCRVDGDELIEEATSINRNLLGDQFKKGNVVDEVVYLQKHLAHEVRTAILAKLTQPAAAFDWDALVATSFDTSTVPADITIAVLQKFIWQVKRRLAELPITYHLMPVVFGNQGCGKSVFITKMLEQLGSLFASTDFARLSDNREADLFRNFALFLDEMNKADRADMDAVKAVITREELSFRPMGTNATVTTVQNACFIGASNKLLEQLINDPTGIRRFFQIDFNSKSGPAEFAFVNSLDFGAMWCSVDHLAIDPTEHFRDEMKALQTRHANRSSVGEFADALVANLGRYRVPAVYSNETSETTLKSGALTKDEIYLAYRDWAAAMKKRAALEQAAFLSELRRMVAQEPGFPIQPRKTNAFNGWHYTGPIAPATVVRDTFHGRYAL